MNAERALCTLLMIVLAGCAGGGNWARPGADEAAVAREYQDCRDLAGTAVRTDADIDQDIAATRNEDRQRGSVMRIQAQTMHEHTRDRAEAIIARCMAAKGFARTP